MSGPTDTSTLDTLLKDMSVEETTRLTTALKDPKFTDLLAEYAREISDPTMRQENEQYLLQLEKEQGLPANCKLIKPQEYVCIKVRAANNQKVFINICTSSLVGEPSSVAANGGAQWSLPHVISPGRPMSLKGFACKVVDVTFHSKIRDLMGMHPQMRQLVQDTAVDVASKQLKMVLKGPIVLRQSKCKDGPPSILRLPSNPAGGSSDQQSTAAAVPEPTEIGEQGDDLVCDQSVRAITTPKYQIIHRGAFEMANHMMNQNVERFSTLPTHLVVKIELPGLMNLKASTLEVNDKSVSLLVPGQYELNASLPIAVDSENGKAAFAARTHILTITLPVKPRQEGSEGGIEAT